MDRLSISFLLALLLHAGFFLGTALVRFSGNEVTKAPKSQGIRLEMLPRVVIPEKYEVVKKAVPAPTGERKASAPAVAKVPTPGAASTGSTSVVSGPQGTGDVESGNGLTQITLEQLKSGFKSEVRARIESKVVYPSMSRRLGHTGKVVVGFTMLKDGTIINVHVHEGCPFDRLNQAAIEAVERAGKFKPIPEELQLTQMEMNVPVVFKQI